MAEAGDGGDVTVEHEQLVLLYRAERAAKQDAERAVDLLARLNTLAMQLGVPPTPAEVPKAVCARARQAAGAQAAALVLGTADGWLELGSVDGTAEIETWRELAAQTSPAADAIRLDAPVVVSSLTEGRVRYPDLASSEGQRLGRAWACLPVRSSGRPVGALWLSFGEPRTFPDTDLAFLGGIAELSGQALERARLLTDLETARAEAEASAARLRRIQHVTDAALGALPLRDLVTELLSRIRGALDADVATLLMLEPERTRLRIWGADGLRPGSDDAVRIPIGRGISGEVAATGVPRVVGDLHAGDEHGAWLPETISSIAAVPLSRRGAVVGVLHVATREPRNFTEDDVELLQLVGARVASALERAELYEGRPET